MLAQPKGGQRRSNAHSHNWVSADLKSTIDRFAGVNPIVSRTHSGKIIYKNRNSGIEVIYDLEGDYFRILDPSISGQRKYLDLDGKVPTNKTLPNGKQTGRTKAEYNEVTHFKVRR